MSARSALITGAAALLTLTGLPVVNGSAAAASTTATDHGGPAVHTSHAGPATTTGPPTVGLSRAVLSRAEVADTALADTASGGDLAAAADQLEIIIEEFNDLREEQRSTRIRVDALSAQIHTLERTISDRQAKLGEFAANAYRAGGMPTVTALLSPTDNLVHPLLLLDRLSQDRQRSIDELTEAHERLTLARSTAQDLATEQARQQRQLSVRRQRIETTLDRLRLRTPSSPRESGPVSALPGGSAGAGATAVRFAHAQLGKPYIWAGEGPQGYDCSGLTAAAWAAAGVRLPHNAARQWGAVTRVSRAERRPGDLIFYYRDIHHVGIYIGGGKIIHAPRPGARIRVDDIDYQPVHGYGRPG